MKILTMQLKKLQRKKNKHIYLRRFIVYNFGMGISFWQIAIVVVLVVLLFGRGKISSLMGDVAKGIKSFKKGMSDDTSINNKEDDSKSENSDSENK